MTRITLTVIARNGQIVITPPPGVELELKADAQDSARMITVAEAAKLLECSGKTISRYCTAGLIPGAKLVGGSYLIPAEHVANLSRFDIKPGRPRKRGRPPDGDGRRRPGKCT